MASKRKPKKNRNTRMDGAIEAMTKEYGFSDEELIRKVAKRLLQEYGGEDGWYFIEQYSYKELLEALLRYQSQCETEAGDTEKRDDLPKNCSTEGEKAKEYASTDEAGPSCVLAEATCSDVANCGLEISSQDDKQCSQPVDRDKESWKDIVLDQAASPREKTGTGDDVHEKLKSCEDAGKSSIPSHLPRISTPPRPPPPPPQSPSKNRKPCYGWIDCDEKNGSDVFIELTRALSWEDLKPAKRRSRWDLRPDDP